VPKLLAASSALFLATLLAGCTAMTAAPEPPPLDGTSWVLSSLPGRTLVGRQPATLSFERGRVQGSDGCNRYSAPYTVKGSALEVSPRGVSTQMACPPEQMKQAEAFTAALSMARSYRVSGGELQLLAADGAVLATLAPQPRTVAGTEWRVTGINNGKEAVTSVLAGSTVTVSFDGSGRASGSAGCNRFTAGYETDGSKLRFLAPGATRKMCAGEGLMAQEQMFLTALESVASMRFEGNRLELRRADGALALTLLREGGG
jgi:heat shock protein HslJ